MHHTDTLHLNCVCICLNTCYVWQLNYNISIHHRGLFSTVLLGLLFQKEFLLKFHSFAQGLNRFWILRGSWLLTACFAHYNSCFWGPRDLVILKCVLEGKQSCSSNENATWEVICERKAQKEQQPWKSGWCTFTPPSCYHLLHFCSPSSGNTKSCYMFSGPCTPAPPLYMGIGPPPFQTKAGQVIKTSPHLK